MATTKISPFKAKFPTYKDIPTFYNESKPELNLNNICQDHIKLFEKSMGIDWQEFLAMPNRLHLALTKAMPIDINVPTLIDSGSFNWGDLLSSNVGIDSDLWSATPFELEIKQYLNDISDLWLEFDCWNLPDDDLIKQECHSRYAELVSGANQYQFLQLPLYVTRYSEPIKKPDNRFIHWIKGLFE